MLNLKRTITTSAIAVAVLLATHVTQAQLIFGIGRDTSSASNPLSLFSFDANSPSTTSALTPITGIATGMSLVAIDFRPATGQLYGLSYDGTNQGQLYIISFSGVATPVGSPITIGSAQGPTAQTFGFGFNPTVDRIRVVTGNQSNFRINPNDGTIVAFDLPVEYVAGDPNEGTTPQISGADYLPDGTLYDIDQVNNTLVLQGSPNPNDGTLRTVGTGGLGFTTAGGNTMGFDITQDGSTAYLQTDTNADADVQDDLYTVDLATGTATLVGAIGSSTNLNTFDIAVVPEPSTYALLATGAIAGVVMLRRRRKAARS